MVAGSRTVTITEWPGPVPAGGPQPTETEFRLFGGSLTISDEVRLLLLVTLTGALGGLLHALRSIATCTKKCSNHKAASTARA